MSTDGDMRERHGRVLAELAETGMVMVRRLSAAMLEADDVRAQVQLGLAYHRVSRAVRQTMALEFKLMQEPRRDAREAVAPARPTPPPQPAAPRPPTERTSWNEYESNDSDEALEALDVLLEAEDFDLDAVREVVETCVARIRHDLDADTALIRGGVPKAACAQADRPPSNPSGRRSRLLGGAAITPSILAAPRPPVPAWRSSA